MHRKFLKILACPVCKGKLEYNAATNEMICANDIAFPIRNEVAVLLEMDARQSASNKPGTNKD